MATRKYDVVAVIGSYKDAQGNEKNRYLNCGVVLSTDKGFRLKLERTREALQPFAKDEFCVELGGNVQGGDSPVFERQRAMLKLSDFRRAQNVWRELDQTGGESADK